MTELEKIVYTKGFIDKLANGINPLDDTPIPDDDIMNNVRLSRRMLYVSDLLRQVIDHGGLERRGKGRKKSFSISQEQLEKYEFGEYPISISEFSNCLLALADTPNMKRLSAKKITNWLFKAGMLGDVKYGFRPGAMMMVHIQAAK